MVQFYIDFYDLMIAACQLYCVFAKLLLKVTDLFASFEYQFIFNGFLKKVGLLLSLLFLWNILSLSCRSILFWRLLECKPGIGEEDNYLHCNLDFPINGQVMIHHLIWSFYHTGICVIHVFCSARMLYKFTVCQFPPVKFCHIVWKIRHLILEGTFRVFLWFYVNPWCGVELWLASLPQLWNFVCAIALTQTNDNVLLDFFVMWCGVLECDCCGC